MTFPDDPAYLRQVLRVYRHAFAEVKDAIGDSEGWTASRVRRSLNEAQERLERVKQAFPGQALEPDELRERNGIADLRRFA